MTHTNPQAALMQMAMGGVVSKVLYLAAKIGLADHLASGPRTATELAGSVGARPDTLHRVLRTLAMLGVVTEGQGQRFALTPIGEALKSDAPGAARAGVLLLAGSFASLSYEHLEHSLQTGEPGFQKAFGAPLFEYLAHHPEDARVFNDAMIGFHGAEPPAVAASYDFASLETVVDVGGGTGNLLATILAHHPRPRGVLYDLAHVVEQAPALLAERGVSARVRLEAGDFFSAVPAGADAYLLSHILHDWSEAQCLTILGNCRKAMKPSSRLLIVEMVLPPGDAPHPGKLLDIVMLAIPGGRERTEGEYAALLAKAGFRLARVVPTASAVSVVEALPA